MCDVFWSLFCSWWQVVLALGYRELVKPATPPVETIVEVVPGMGTRAIGALLAQHGIIRSQYAFDIWHLVRGGTLKAGEYQFVQPATLPAVYNRIVRGDVYTRTVTIPEGYNLFDIAQAVEDAQLGSKDRFLAAASQDVALIADLDPTAKTLEGYLFPDTYRFPRRLTPQQMLAAMVRRFRQNSAAIGLDRELSPCGDPGLAGRKRDAGGGGPAAGRQRAPEPAGQGHAADDRPHGDLCRHVGEAIPGNDLPV